VVIITVTSPCSDLLSLSDNIVGVGEENV